MKHREVGPATKVTQRVCGQTRIPSHLCPKPVCEPHFVSDSLSLWPEFLQIQIVVGTLEREGLTLPRQGEVRGRKGKE